MAFSHVDLDKTGGVNDGTSWDDAFEGMPGLVTAVAAAVGGDTVYVKDNDSTSSVTDIAGNTALADWTNPILIIGVVTATANVGVNIVQSDLIPGLRTGNSTRAYDQTSGNAAPILATTGAGDVTFSGALYLYGLVVTSEDNIELPNDNSACNIIAEECSFTVTGGGDLIAMKGDASGGNNVLVNLLHCKVAAGAGKIQIGNQCHVKCFACDIDCSATGSIQFTEHLTTAKFYACDLSGCSASGVFDVANILGGAGAELWNCKMPASHTLTTGTPTGLFMIANYGSQSNTGLDSADSEQELEIHTREGTVDIEPVVFRTGGADDEATDSGGKFAWALIPQNVADNVVGVVSPWMEKWVLGDGTAKTLTVFFCNGAAEAAANLIEKDQAYLEVMFPDEAGTSIYQYLPDDGAPGDGGGRMQLLGTTGADIATDGSTWGSGGNNKQKFTQAIAPDYRGLVRARVHYSMDGGPTLFQDPAMTVA